MICTIDIETFEDTATAEEVVDRVAEQLQGSRAKDPSVSINTSSGVVAATFQIEAESMDEAVRLAVELFTEALETAGAAPESGLLKAEEVGSVTVVPARDRELVGA